MGKFMCVRFSILLVLCLATAPLAVAQTQQTEQDVDEYFHSGAKHYIDNELDDASSQVEQGLAIDPNHPKLLALKAEIEKQQEQQQNQNQNQNQENQSEQDNQDQQQQDQEDEEQQNQQDQQEDGEQNEDNTEQENQDAPGEQEEEDSGEEPRDPNELSKEQAERILQALQNEEGELLREIRKVKGRARRVEKDW